MKPQIGINSGSMADIAFLLLIFFMVTTTIQSEAGLLRKLPPDVESSGTIKERNVLQVMINKNDALLVDNKESELNELQEIAYGFITNPDNRLDLPEKSLEYIPSIGEFPVSKQIISLQNDRLTRYGAYVAVHDALTGAYLKARNELAVSLFNITYDELLLQKDAEKIDAIRKAIPMRISEAEPFQSEQP